MFLPTHFTKIILLLSFVFCSNFLVAQDTLYYDRNGEDVADYESCFYYKITHYSKEEKDKVEVLAFFKNGQPKYQKNYYPYSDKTLHGKLKIWFEGGQLQKEANYKDGALDGELITYWENGNKRRLDSYSNNELLSGTTWDKNGNEIPYFDYIIYPEFPGGVDEMMRFLVANIKYPKKAKRKSISGKVYVVFIVNKDGSISNIEVEEEINTYLDKEALRVVNKMPHWIPGKVDGEAKRFSFKLPVNFVLKS